MSEEELDKLAWKKAEEETASVDDCEYDGCNQSCAETYYFAGFKDGYKYALKELEKQLN